MLRLGSTRAGWLALLVTLLLSADRACAVEPADAAPANPVSVESAETLSSAEFAVEYFEKNVRPILVARCHECHAGGTHKGNLRLDSRTALLAGGDTGPAVVAGIPDESLLVDAVRYGDLYQMPPDSQLPKDEIETLENWVRMGAAWGTESAESPQATAKEFDLAARSAHWSFQPLAKVTPPQVGGIAWVRTPVDAFVLQKLEAADFSPAPPADRRTLLRRVSFDLIGLPPTPEEIDSFVNDVSPNAYGKVVQRLLDSPRYGERWARHWLDLIRFAETQGHEFDFEIPNAYRYRDYVIRALNADLPYDQFVVEHIAGDLLKQPRRNPEDGCNESIIATGWYFFGEAVHSPVDVRADEATRIDNQIDVFSKTFLGLTVSCARCHDHKFDAISTKDYYALAGYLQSSRYQQAPIGPTESNELVREELRRLNDDRQRLTKEFVGSEVSPRIAQLADGLLAIEPQAFSESARMRSDDLLFPWTSLTASQASSPEEFSRRRQELAERLRTEVSKASAPAAFQSLDIAGAGFSGWQATGLAFGSPGKPLEWIFESPGSRNPQRMLTVPTVHSARLSHKLQGALRSPTFEISGPKLWYRLYGTGGQVRLVIDGFQLIRAPIYGGLEFDAGGPQPHWHEQDLSKWIGHRAYIELVDDGEGYLALEQVGFGDVPPNAAPNRFIVEMLEDSGITARELLAARYQELFGTSLRDWLADQVSADRDHAELIAWALQQRLVDPTGMQDAEARYMDKASTIDEQQRTIEARLKAPPMAPAILDGTAENEHVFIRGNHKTLGDEVPRRFLEVLQGTTQSPPEQGSGRLELARQMVSPAAPVVPRVIVNRLWHHHFGMGLVRSPDDFGVMGQEPTHPELLDYLANQLIENGWSLKHLHRLMVMSNAYRMSSQVDPQRDAADPQNKLWHRMAVKRLEAESIRDAMLFVSGRLDDSMYGPGVMPHLTDFMTGRGRPNQSGPLDGDGRRSIYLTVRRNFLSPLFLAFDYPTPFTTIGRRGTSNVPAQALTMMNNALVLQQASIWANRVLAQSGLAPQDRIRGMYVSAFGREPDKNEMLAAMEFVGTPGEGFADRQAWADLAHVLFNVKEFIYIP